MRTTVNLDDDVVAAIDRLRQSQRVGFSEAVNALARAGSTVVDGESSRVPFVQQTANLGIMVDVSNVAETLDMLDAADDR